MEATTKPVTRKDISDESKWDLNGLYPQESVWQDDFDQLEKDIAGYESFEGALADSVRRIKACLEFDMDISRKIEKLYTYAHLRNDEDKTNAPNQM